MYTRTGHTHRLCLLSASRSYKTSRPRINYKPFPVNLVCLIYGLNDTNISSVWSFNVVRLCMFRRPFPRAPGSRQRGTKPITVQPAAHGYKNTASTITNHEVNVSLPKPFERSYEFMARVIPLANCDKTWSNFALRDHIYDGGGV